jgi:hypothetical protein
MVKHLLLRPLILLGACPKNLQTDASLKRWRSGLHGHTAGNARATAT